MSNIVEAVAELGSECYRDRQALLSALVELVACKDLKERAAMLERNNIHSQFGAAWESELSKLHAEYLRRQPEAWANARTLIALATT